MSQPKTIDLALQGGGAHGAFTWGVLDYLLEKPEFRIGAVSATSAGALNAVAMADGLARGGRDEARQALRRLWQAVSRAVMLSPIRRTPLDLWMGNWALDRSPGYLAFDLLSRVASPYEFNPADVNPLRNILDEQIDFQRVRESELKLFICATNVRTAKLRAFRNAELNRDVLLASTCLPLLTQAVDIDGDTYWDGAYMSNPALFPLLDESSARDIIVVQINPIYREEVPRTAEHILNRVNELTFTSSFLKELHAVARLKRLSEEHGLDNRYRHTCLHRINENALLRGSPSTKFNGEWSFLRDLHARGRRAAEVWLEENAASLGQRSTLELDDFYQ